MNRRLLLALLVCLLTAQVGFAADRTWEVTVTNITANQIISPPILVVHNHKTRLFRAGKSASPELAAVAEDADSAALVAKLQADPNVGSIVMGGGPLMPGASMKLMVTTTDEFQRVSAVGMLVTTNDAFFGIDSHILHDQRVLTSIYAPAWDAGSEANNELCSSIPGPPCGNPHVRDTAGAEGFIHIHPGISGRGDLDPADFSWPNPVVELQFSRQ